MITVTAANGKDLCATCRSSIAAVNIELGDGTFHGLFPLCDRCTRTLMENLQRKEAPTHANPIQSRPALPLRR